MYKITYDNRDGANKIWRIGIRDGNAYVDTLNLPKTFPSQDRLTWNTVLKIGEAVDCDMAFDARWKKKDIYKWEFTSIDEPWFFWIDKSGKLWGKHWMDAPFLMAEGVSEVVALRGWKNTYLWNHDHGIVVGYIKDGVVCYRNYCQQPDQVSTIWEIERQVPEIPAPAQNLSLFRTNDYRVGLMAESNGTTTKWAITTRNWATMAVENHSIKATITDVFVDLKPIIYTDLYLKHHISASITDTKVMLCPNIYPQVLSIANEDEFTIIIECDLPIYEDLTGMQSAFTVKDSANTTFAITSMMKYNDRFIVLTLTNFSSASGDMTVIYDYNIAPIHSQVQGGCLMQLSSFTKTFKPDLAPPEGFSSHNISAAITNVVVDFKPIVYKNISHKHNITASITDVSVAFIHIKDINP